MSNKIFVSGLYLSKKSENCPEFIKLRMSFKSKEFIAFLKEHTNEGGYCNIDLKKSKEGKYYFELNNWKKGDNTGRDDEGYEKAKDIDPDDIPL